MDELKVRSTRLFNKDPEAWDLAKERFNRNLELLCQRTARIITQDFNLSVVPTRNKENGETYEINGAPAGLVDSNTIVLDHNRIIERSQGTGEDRVGLTMSLLMHEVGHHQHSPGITNPEWANMHWQALRALNALEDPRQERLISARYNKTEDYFRLAASRFIIKVITDRGGGDLDSMIAAQSYPLIKGREHLFKKETLKIFSDAFDIHFPGSRDEVDQIISEYQKILAVSPQDRRHMRDLAQRLATILGNVVSDNCLPQTKLVRGKAGLKDIRDDMDEALKKELRRQREAEKKEGSANSDQESSSESDDEEGNDPMSVIEALQDEGGRSLERMRAELNEQMSSAHLKGRGAGKGTSTMRASVPVTIDALTAKKIERIFSLPMLDLRMEERRRQRSGRLDMNRLSNAIVNGSPRIFRKRRKDLTQNASVAVHVSLDYSSSMGGVTPQVLSAGGTLMKAIAGAQHNTKLSVFSDDWQILKDWDSVRVNGVTISQDGTQPEKLLQHAHNDFLTRQYSEGDRRQIFIIMTDGGWVGNCDRYIKAMRTEGVLVVLIDFDHGESWGESHYGDHGADMHFRVKTVPELADTLKEVIGEMAKEAIKEVTTW